MADEHDPAEADYGGVQVLELASVSDGTVALRLDYARGEEVLKSVLRVFTVSEGTIGEVTEPLAIESLSYLHAGTSMDDVYEYRAQRGEESCTVSVAYDYLGLSFEDDAADPSFMDQLGLAAACDVASWDGFSETDGHALDGESFSLSVTLADGTTVQAQGSNAAPAGHGSFASMLCLLYQPYASQLQEEGE